MGLQVAGLEIAAVSAATLEIDRPTTAKLEADKKAPSFCSARFGRVPCTERGGRGPRERGLED